MDVDPTQEADPDLDRWRFLRDSGTSLVQPGLRDATGIFAADRDPDLTAVTAQGTLPARMRTLWSGQISDPNKPLTEKGHREIRLRRYIFGIPCERRTAMIHKQREIEKWLDDADRETAGHRRSHRYLNFAITITKDDLQALHPHSDIAWQGIQPQVIETENLCTINFMNLLGFVRPDMLEQWKDNDGKRPCCKAGCWFCQTINTLKLTFDLASLPTQPGVGLCGTLAPALNQWLIHININLPEHVMDALPLDRRWGELRDASGEIQTNQLWKTAWVLWYAGWLLEEKHYQHIVKLGGVRLPTWKCLDAPEQLKHLVTIMEIYHCERDGNDDQIGSYLKFQATQDIPDQTYAALWNSTLADENRERGGPALTVHDKASAIDFLIGLGRAWRYIRPTLRQRLYAEIGDLNQMSFYWEILLNKFADGNWHGHGELTTGETEGVATPASGPYLARNRDGATVQLWGSNPLFETPYWAARIFLSESNAA